MRNTVPIEPQLAMSYPDTGQHLQDVLRNEVDYQSMVGALETIEDTGIKPGNRSIKLVPFDGLLTNHVLTDLPGEDFARLLPHLEPVFFEAGQRLYKYGEHIDFVYFPETAVFSHVYFFKDGGTTGGAIVGHEGILGLSAILNSGKSTHWTQAMLSGIALRAAPAIIQEEFSRGQAIQRLLLAYTNMRLDQVSQRAVCNGRHKLDERLCTWLLMVCDRAGEAELPLTHEDIAYHLGARRAGISSACSVLRSGQAIDYRRGLIRIIDRKKLEAASCECYQTLRDHSYLHQNQNDIRGGVDQPR